MVSLECIVRTVFYYYGTTFLPAALWRTVVDGFANVLHSSPHRPQLRPNLITGDFDSIKKEAMTFYKEEVGFLSD